MANKFEVISTATVGSGGVSSIDFTSIPQTYTDLLIKGSTRTTQNQRYGVIYIKINTSSSNISQTRITGDGSGAATDTGAENFVALGAGNTATADTFGTFDIYFPNYTSANAKNFCCESTAESNHLLVYCQMYAGLWNPGTQAGITEISLYTGNTIVQYSTATLYGITKY